MRARMPAASRREQLLDVARDLVLERGFHGLTIDAVARRAGITRPIVYAHFEDLGGLLEEMLAREGARAIEQLGPVTAASSGGDLSHAFTAYLDAVAAEPARWRLVLMPPEGAPALLRDRIKAGREAVVSMLAAGLAARLREAAPPDAELTALLLNALAEEAARLLLTDPTRFPPGRLVAHALWLLDRLDLSSN